MKLNLQYRLGLRAYKTAFALMLTLLICALFNRSNAFYGSIAVIMCIQKNSSETIKKGIERVVGTILGGGLGYLFIIIFALLPHYTEYLYIVIAPFGVLVVIYLLNVVDEGAAISIACVVFLSIVVNFNREMSQMLPYVIDRVIDTSIGVIVAMLIDFIGERIFDHKIRTLVK